MARVTKHCRCLEVCEIYYNAGKSGLKSDIPRWIFDFIQKCPQIEVFRLWSPSGDCGGLDNKCIAAMVAGWVCLQHLELTGEAITLDGVILLKACSGLKTARLSHISLGARRRFDSPQPSSSGVLTSRLYELTLDAPPNQELLFVPAKSSKKAGRALKVDGDSEIYKEPPSPGWAELKAQCERMEEENRRITSIDLTHIPEANTESDPHGVQGSRRRRGKDEDGVVIYGLGWQRSREVERSNGPDHEVEIEILPQRIDSQQTGGGNEVDLHGLGWQRGGHAETRAAVGSERRGGEVEEVKHARKSHRRQQSCPTDYSFVERTERSERTERERAERTERAERDGGTADHWLTRDSLPAGLLAGSSSGAQWEGAGMQEQQQQQQLWQGGVENRNKSERSVWQEAEMPRARSQQQRRGMLSLFATWHSPTRSRAEEFQSAVKSLSPPPPPPASLPASPPPAFSFPSLTPEPPSFSRATRHRRCFSGVLQPTYALTGEHPSDSFTGQQPTYTPSGLGYEGGEGERIAGTQSSRGRESLGVQQEARLFNPLGSRLNPHFTPCRPSQPQESASDDSAASASLSESPLRLLHPLHEDQPPCQVRPALLVTRDQGWPGQGQSGEVAFERVRGRLKAPPGNAPGDSPDSWQQVMEERVREAFAMGYLAGLRDAAAHTAPPAPSARAATSPPPAAATAAGALPGQFQQINSPSNSRHSTSHATERAPPRMFKSNTVSGGSHCHNRSPLQLEGGPFALTQQSSTVSGGASHSHGGSPLRWEGDTFESTQRSNTRSGDSYSHGGSPLGWGGEVQMPHRSHARLKGPLQARMVVSGPLQPRSGPLQPRHGLLEPQLGPLQPWTRLLEPRSGPLQPRTDLLQSQQPPMKQPNREGCRLSTSGRDSAGCASVRAEGARGVRIPLNQLQPQQPQPLSPQQVGEQRRQQEKEQEEQAVEQEQQQQAGEQGQQEQQGEGWRERWRRVRHRRSGSLGAWQELPGSMVVEEEGPRVRSVQAVAAHSAATFERSFSDSTGAGPGVGAGAASGAGAGAGEVGVWVRANVEARTGMEEQAVEQTATAASAASCAAAASCPAAASSDAMGVCSDAESDADSCRSPGGGGGVGVGGVHTGASCTGLRLSRRLFSGRLLLTRDSS
ncbi:unnamed protein product [Closterium sp. Naga37s-1]|nr:unnamed protein product [Closterium sp. Naga37s-1]